MMIAAVPLEKQIVLVGAGNAHLVFLKKWGMRPLPGVAVTLVSEAAVIPYSAMVPGHIAGDYDRAQITIDLVRFCQSVGVRLLPQRVQALDPLGRRIILANRPPLTYDLVSLGIGSLPAAVDHENNVGQSWLMRPLGHLLQRLDDLDHELRQTGRPFHLVVVGGGVSGCELTLAIHKRLRRHPAFRLTLLQGPERLTPTFPEAVSRAFARACAERGIDQRVGARVAGQQPGQVILADGEILQADAVLWATQAAPASLVKDAGLGVNEAGFLRVRSTLQSVEDPHVFGTGDCVAFEAYPELPRNGVYAVRQGEILFHNLGATLRGLPLRPFEPQRYCLCLMNTADDEAILNYGPITWKSRLARRVKDRIDQAWIQRFIPRLVVAGAGAEEPQMRCGGCASKIASDVLGSVLKSLDIPSDARILLGCRAGEDAAVHRVRPELFGKDPGRLVEVQTVDSFKTFLDDPYLFGRITAMHAVSDLYAMNARPFSALALATLPYARPPIQEALLREMLSGALESFRELGVVLTGGHTTEGSELALGFAVTGHGEEDALFQKKALQPGEVLILTKPLGSGALLAAWMRGQCQATWFQEMLQQLLRANDRAAAIFAAAGTRACTDVTGFGLVGHLFEMLDGSGVSARLRLGEIPVLPGFEETARNGILSTLHPDNSRIRYRLEGSGADAPVLYDPQTSGGLLAAVRPEQVAEILEQLKKAGYHRAARIGEILPLPGRTRPNLHVE